MWVAWVILVGVMVTSGSALKCLCGKYSSDYNPGSFNKSDLVVQECDVDPVKSENGGFLIEPDILEVDLHVCYTETGACMKYENLIEKNVEYGCHPFLSVTIADQAFCNDTDFCNRDVIIEHYSDSFNSDVPRKPTDEDSEDQSDMDNVGNNLEDFNNSTNVYGRAHLNHLPIIMLTVWFGSMTVISCAFKYRKKKLKKSKDNDQSNGSCDVEEGNDENPEDLDGSSIDTSDVIFTSPILPDDIEPNLSSDDSRLLPATSGSSDSNPRSLVAKFTSFLKNKTQTKFLFISSGAPSQNDYDLSESIARSWNENEDDSSARDFTQMNLCQSV